MSVAMNDPTGDYVEMESVDWAPFPDGLCDGPIRWKLLHVAPESGAWAAIFDCPAGTSFARHIHMGPGKQVLDAWAS